MKMNHAIFIPFIIILFLLTGCGESDSSDFIDTPAVPQAGVPEVITPERAEVLPDESSEEIAEDTFDSDTSEEYDSDVSNDIPTVYFTTDLSPEGLMAVYEALGVNPEGNIAIKVTTGEPPNSNYLREELIGGFTRFLDGTIVESNTVYGGSRASDAKHIQVAKDHGFYDMTPKGFDLQDSGGSSIGIPVSGGEILTENFVGGSFFDYDYYVVLSHFKGHGMSGFGGAIKNISIGIASREGKNWLHSGGTSKTRMRGDSDTFIKAMAESGKAVADALDGNLLYINVMNRLSVDCDCDGNPAEPDMHDIGILASLDPVALDKACVDLVEAAPDGATLMNRINSRNGMLVIDHAVKMGLGSAEYRLVRVDD